MRIFEFKKPRELFDQTIHQYQQKARATQASKTATFYAGHWTFDDEKRINDIRLKSRQIYLSRLITNH
ncbi:hypothetical protein [Latilactobacillus sakei]|uniref:hypothetical protein n=1 Tax=Latilactobacillus sakei TaxID=1599 RepID=UPI000A64A2C8